MNGLGFEIHIRISLYVPGLPLGCGRYSIGPAGKFMTLRSLWLPGVRACSFSAWDPLGP